MDPVTKICADGSDPDFVWDDYLEETDSIAAPPTSFSHVEYSLVSSFKLGMNLEVPNPEVDDTYWVASAVMICGPLLSLRFLGYGEDRSADFWFDVKAGEFHPVGWCAKNKKKLHPPKGVLERHENFMNLLTSELEMNTVPVSLLNDPEAGVTPVDQIKVGMLIEVTNEYMQEEWPARIIQNVGGRLLLRYEGSPDTGDADFWLFYLSERIHSIGWANKPFSQYVPPSGKKINLTESQRQEIIKTAFNESLTSPFPVHVLEPQLLVEDNGFQEGMKLEVLNPLTLLDVRAATVTQVINSKFFVVEVDRLAKENQGFVYPAITCHSSTQVVFPCNWAKQHGLKCIGPNVPSQSDDNFDWDQYLLFCNAVAAPNNLFEQGSGSEKFEVGMKLEAVNPFFPEQVHVSTVEKVVEPLIWVRLDSATTPKPNHITVVDSFDIFPVGWCASNGYFLHTPTFTKRSLNAVSSSANELTGTSACARNKDTSSYSKDSPCGKAWCPKIYFNHCCFTGPYLSKSRLAELPQAIGPGPVDLVMKDVLTRLINIAYKSSRVLKELQVCGKPDPSMLQQTVKAKYKGKSYRATVEFIRNSEEVEDFCRKICYKLDCCPHLFGPNLVGQDCPENCYNLTKTKFGHGFLKRQKKPISSVNAGNSPEEGPEVKKGPGRKKKRRKHLRLVNRDVVTLSENRKESPEHEVKSLSKEPSSDSCDDETVEELAPARKKQRVPSPTPAPQESKIVTRGAKIPNFSLAMQWKSHNSARHSGANKVYNLSRTVPAAVKKKGRPLGSTKKSMTPVLTRGSVAEQSDNSSPAVISDSRRVLKDAEQIGLVGNPVEWSVDDVYKYMKSTPCAPLAQILKAQEIDGQALLMLTLHSVQEFLHLKSEPAKVLCTLIENLKYEFFTEFM